MDLAMTHLLDDDDGMTIYVGCPETVGDDDGRLLLAGFYQELLGWRMGEVRRLVPVTTAKVPARVQRQRLVRCASAALARPGLPATGASRHPRTGRRLPAPRSRLPGAAAR